MKILYGPLYSRRLGISVGIDIIPYKTCSYNCVYCHEGETTHLTCSRQRFLDPEKVLEALSTLAGQKQRRGLDIDYLTFAGSGEPTLNRELGRYIRYLKNISPVPIAVITNSSLLWDEQVRKDLLLADLVVPSLDAACEAVFQQVNRPAENLSLDRVIQGLRQFCGEFAGRIWLEVLLCRGMNDSEGELQRLAGVISTLKVDKVQINTVSRPPALESAGPVLPETLHRFQGLLGGQGEIVEDEGSLIRKNVEKELEKALLARLKYKPGNLHTLAREINKSGQEVIKVLARLEKEGVVQRFMRGKTSYYRILGNKDERSYS